MMDPMNDIRGTALLQALERQRNEAMNREASLSAGIALLQQQLQMLTNERDGLKAELEKLKAEDATSNLPSNPYANGELRDLTQQ